MKRPLLALGIMLAIATTGCEGAAHAARPRSTPTVRVTPSPSPSATLAVGPGVIPLDPPRPAVTAATVRVPILMYHYVRTVSRAADPLGFGLSVTPSDFAAQMDWLVAQGFHPINLGGLNAYLAGTANLPARPVVLTFDDGYQDFYTAAWPVLRAHGFTAVSFIITNRIGTAGYMTAGEILALDRAGVQIGCHTVSHPDLATLRAAQVRFQVTRSEQVLTGLLGHPVPDFAYPSGRYNQGVIESLIAAGYRDAVTTQPGSELATHGPGRFTWPRVRVAGGETPAQYAAALLASSR